VAVLKVCYKSGVRFDEQYYLSTHIPLAAAYFARFGIRNVEVVRFGEAAGQAPVYQVIITAHFETMAGLQQAMSDPGLANVLADVPNYYDGVPDVLVGETLALPAAG
jgi:uncharacterized protein (TIGR02118 family)